jgi:hypothetical protein
MQQNYEIAIVPFPGQKVEILKFTTTIWPSKCPVTTSDVMHNHALAFMEGQQARKMQ